MLWAAIKMIMGLGAVLIALYFLVRLARRSGVGLRDGEENSWVRLIGNKPIAPHKSISLLEVGGELWVLGMTESQINLLDKITNPERAARMMAAASARKVPLPWMDRWISGIRQRPRIEQGFNAE